MRWNGSTKRRILGRCRLISAWVNFGRERGRVTRETYRNIAGNEQGEAYVIGGIGSLQKMPCQRDFTQFATGPNVNLRARIWWPRPAARMGQPWRAP